MNAIHLGLTGAALLLATPAAVAQSPPPAPQAAMRPFDRWIGEWSGSGWSTSATGERTEFTLVESVRPKVGGSVLLLEGRGTTASGTVTHDGLVVLYYDEKAGGYRWNGHDLGRAPIDAEAKLVDGGLEWSIAPDGRTTVRFRIQFDEKRWHEVGEVSVGGTTWTRFMEMNLLRR
jgi:hypothetical protein